jgi:hypothetical protein
LKPRLEGWAIRDRKGCASCDRGVARPAIGELRQQRNGEVGRMYIGVGTIVLILVIVLLIAFVF